MSAHTSAHEPVLQALVLGEVVGDAARAEIVSCAVCGPQLSEFGRITRRLPAQGEQERRDLVHAESLSDPSDRALVASTLRDAMSGATRPVRALPSSERRPRRLALWIAAACLLATCVFVTDLGVSIPDPGDVDLGGPKATLLRPKGEGSDFSHFAWSGKLLPNESFVVRVNDPERQREIDVHSTFGTTWDPPSSETAGWPDRIEWTLSTVLGGIVQWSSPPQSASR